VSCRVASAGGVKSRGTAPSCAWRGGGARVRNAETRGKCYKSSYHRPHVGSYFSLHCLFLFHPSLFSFLHALLASCYFFLLFLYKRFLLFLQVTHLHFKKRALLSQILFALRNFTSSPHLPPASTPFSMHAGQIQRPSGRSSSPRGYRSIKTSKI
jgi:hypothetical protein